MRHPTRLLAILVAVAYLGLVTVATFGYVTNAKVVKKETLQQTAVQRCLAGRRFLLRQQALERMVLTQQQLDQLDRLAHFPVPTVAECKMAG